MAEGDEDMMLAWQTETSSEDPRVEVCDIIRPVMLKDSCGVHMWRTEMCTEGQGRR